MICLAGRTTYASCANVLFPGETHYPYNLTGSIIIGLLSSVLSLSQAHQVLSHNSPSHRFQSLWLFCHICGLFLFSRQQTPHATHIVHRTSSRLLVISCSTSLRWPKSAPLSNNPQYPKFLVTLSTQVAPLDQLVERGEGEGQLPE